MKVQRETLAQHFLLTEQSVFSHTIKIFAFAVLTAVGARLELLNEPVPYTLQTLFVLLAGAFLGMRDGALSQVLYLFVGILGAPVFSGGGFGVAKILGPTGGYLLSFPLMAMLVGYLVSLKKGLLWTIISMASGLLLMFTSGTIQLNFVYFHDWSKAIQSGFVIFSWWDFIKLLAAATIYDQFAKRWRKETVQNFTSTK